MQSNGYVTYFKMPYRQYEMDKQAIDCLENREFLHKEIQKMFGTSRIDSSVLYRIDQSKREQAFLITVKSAVVPNIEASSLFRKYKTDSESVDLSKYYAGLKEGFRANFKLEAFPYYYIFKEGKKNPVRRVIKDSKQRVEWLRKKLSESGLELVYLAQDKDDSQKKISKASSGTGYFKTFQFSGKVVVKDEEKAARALENGIGPEKAYGAGLLVLY